MSLSGGGDLRTGRALGGVQWNVHGRGKYIEMAEKEFKIFTMFQCKWKALDRSEYWITFQMLNKMFLGETFNTLSRSNFLAISKIISI